MKHVLFFIVSILILLGCLCVGVYGSLYYTTVPFPSPKPYPGSQVEQGKPAIGAGRRSIEFEYTVNCPLEEMQQYYEEEMNEYCEDGWQFSETENACVDFIDCRVANCKIPRPFVKDAQSFLVYLRSVSATQTNVVYIQTTYDP